MSNEVTCNKILLFHFMNNSNSMNLTLNLGKGISSGSGLPHIFGGGFRGSRSCTGGYVGSFGTFPSYLYNFDAPLTRKGSTTSL